MTAGAFAKWGTDVVQCDALIVSAHQQDQSGKFLFSNLDRSQITKAAFLNLYIAWEEFLEGAISSLMSGDSTINGNKPKKYVSPTDVAAAKSMVVGVMKYFDYGNRENFKRICKMYFDGGAPFEPHLSSISSELDDMRTIRHSCAHISASTQRNLENLALRIFGKPALGVDAYDLLVSLHPAYPKSTVYKSYRDKLDVVVSLIANG